MNKEKVKSIEQDLDTAKKLEAYSNSEGANLLVDSLVSDIISNIETIGSKYNTLTHLEFIAIGASIKEKLDMTRAIKRAPKNKKYLKDLLEEALQE